MIRNSRDIRVIRIIKHTWVIRDVCIIMDIRAICVLRVKRDIWVI